MLNKQTGNMYPFVTHTWNPIRGECPHDCLYCYMKDLNVGDLRIVPKELGTNLGVGNYIFVGSSTDMWADIVPAMWIEDVLESCCQFDNKYLFQTKNPKRFMEYWGFPQSTVLACTIESNRCWNGSKAPCPCFRYEAMKQLNGSKMISIEPILDFDLDIMVQWIQEIKPDFVSIGADSKRHNLPEPTSDKINTLIDELRGFTDVILKDNLKRLLR